MRLIVPYIRWTSLSGDYFYYSPTIWNNITNKSKLGEELELSSKIMKFKQGVKKLFMELQSKQTLIYGLLPTIRCLSLSLYITHETPVIYYKNRILTVYLINTIIICFRNYGHRGMVQQWLLFLNLFFSDIHMV